jgi:glycosyltransferase involved in cell wall biosynthesis
MARIAMVVFSYYPADPRVRREAEVLERAGHSVDVLCLRKNGETGFESFGSVAAYRVMSGSENKESLLKYFALSSVFGLASLLKLAALSLKRRYALVQVHNMPDFLVFTAFFHKLRGVPVVLDLHDLTVELFESKTAGRPLKTLLGFVKAVERLSCAFADQLITTSAGFRNKLIERGVKPGKVTLVLNSADDRIFSLPPPRAWEKIKNGPVLLYHGTVAKRFGLHVAIEAVESLRRVYPGARLKIYGKYDPTYKAELEELAARKGLESSVSINGFLPLDKVSSEIASSDIGVVPYLSDPFMNLALSTKIFEYVSMGMPVVAAGLDSIKEIFGEGSIKYFRPGDPEDMSEKIAEFCMRPQERRAFSEKAQNAYSAVAWPIMSSRYLETVNTLISGIKPDAKH